MTEPSAAPAIIYRGIPIAFAQGEDGWTATYQIGSIIADTLPANSQGIAHRLATTGIDRQMRPGRGTRAQRTAAKAASARPRCTDCNTRAALKNSSRCKNCARIRAEKLIADNIAIWRARICPECGAGLHLNLSITGWVQCDQLGADGFRKDSSKPACNFQCFIA